MQDTPFSLSRRVFLRGMALSAGAIALGAGCGGGSGGQSSAASPYQPNLTQFTPNYATEVALDHWPAMPVRVYFANDLTVTTVGGSPTRVNPLIQTGFNRWAAGTGGIIGYQIVTDPTQAEITLSVTTIPDPTGLSETGQTSVQTAVGGVLTAATVQIYVWPDITVAELTQGLLATATHEFGHALGIAGHSSNPSDVMYAQHQPSQDMMLSVRDINTIKTIYYFLT